MHLDDVFVDHVFEFRLLRKSNAVTRHRVPVADDTQFTSVVLPTEIVQDDGIVEKGVQFSANEQQNGSIEFRFSSSYPDFKARMPSEIFFFMNCFM